MKSKLTMTIKTRAPAFIALTVCLIFISICNINPASTVFRLHTDGKLFCVLRSALKTLMDGSSLPQRMRLVQSRPQICNF